MLELWNGVSGDWDLLRFDAALNLGSYGTHLIARIVGAKRCMGLGLEIAALEATIPLDE